jgi:two-component system OmpR family response regulator
MTVLVADDDPGVLNVLRMALQRAGHRVLCARCSDEVEVWFTRQVPDLLVLDAGMPGSMDLASGLRERHVHLRVLYVSGYPISCLPNLQLEAGDSFVQKPFMPAEFVAHVEQMLATDAVDSAGTTPDAG